MKSKWKKIDSVDGTWWEADIHLGAILINIMVDENGYTIADGGGSTILEVNGRKGEKIVNLAMEAARMASDFLADAAAEANTLRFATGKIKEPKRKKAKP